MKRILSAILCMVLLLALCPAAMAANNDYAAYYLTEYRVQSGDTLDSICKSRGIQYAEYATVIKNVNGLSNPNRLVAGNKLWIPTKTLGDADRYYVVYRHVLVKGDTISGLCTTYGTTLKAVEAMTKSLNGVSDLTSFTAGTSISFPVPGGSLTATAPAPSATQSTTAASTAATTSAAAGQSSVKAQQGDYVAFYLSSYECKAGDTLIDICKARGVSYGSYKSLILSFNKLASETSLIAGRSYWMPSATVGSATVYYAVYSHLLVSGDTMYALCNAYGINMQKYTDMILKLNGKKDLTSFQAGKPVYLPVYCDNTGNGTVPGSGGGLDETKAGVGSGVVTTKTGTDANGNPVTVTTSTSTTVTELPGLFDATASGSYYLVPYTVKAGESLIGICNDLGSSFSKNKNIIVAANNLKSYTVTVGSTLYIPVISRGNATKYYSVSTKTINWGDTVYGFYCAAKADYSANAAMFNALNGSVNVNNLPVNGKLVIPVLVG